MPGLNKKPKAVYILFAALFLDFLAFGISIPLYAPLFFDLENGMFDAATPLSHRTVLYGMIIGFFSLAQFVGAPLLGTLSDKFGRRKLLMTAVFTNACCYLLFAAGIYYKEIILLFIARIGAGFSGATLPVAQSALSDISNSKNKANYFGLAGAAFGLGLVLGPGIGGLLANPGMFPGGNFALPFIVGSSICLLNLMMVFVLLNETIFEKTAKKLSATAGIKNVGRAFSGKNYGVMFIVIFILTLGFAFFIQFFQVFLIKNHHYSVLQIGILYAYIGVWVAITQGIIIRPLTKRYNTLRILAFSIILLAFSYPILLFIENPNYLFLAMPVFAIFQGITFPNTLAEVSNRADISIQGEVIGINQSVQSLATAIPPLVGGYAVSLSLNLPAWIGAICTLLAWFIFMIAIFRTRAKRKRAINAQQF